MPRQYLLGDDRRSGVGADMGWGVNRNMDGISVVICCHNSSSRLAETLNHLKRQIVPSKIPWEVIIVDNASTDNTADFAKSFWDGNPVVPFKIVHEPKIGICHARLQGIREAKYNIISFIDDDNWVGPDWISLVFETMAQNPRVGACGGIHKAVCESKIPWWFKKFQNSFAIGPQGDWGGHITESRGYLWGAGMNIRRVAINEAINNGSFKNYLSGRKGAWLSSGEDSEFSYALRLNGWLLLYEPRLQLDHFLPASRLEWTYLRRLHRGFGAADPSLFAYRQALKKGPDTFSERLRRKWYLEALGVLILLLWKSPKLIQMFFYPMEGDSDVLRIERRIGKMMELLRQRKIYNSNILELLGSE